MRTKHAIVDVTEDHSLMGRGREIINPYDLVIDEKLLHNPKEIGEPEITFNEFIVKM